MGKGQIHQWGDLLTGRQAVDGIRFRQCLRQYRPEHQRGADIQHLRRTAFPVRSGNAESESAYQRLQSERHKCTMEQIRRTNLYVDGRPGIPACLYLQSGQRENPPPRPAGRRHLQLLASRSRSGHVLLRTERIQRQPPVQLQHQE